MKILSIDLGRARTGIAISDVTELYAHPLCVINERKEDNLAQKIISIAKENNVEEIVLGLPKNMDGSLGESAQRAIAFGEKLKEHLSIPLVMRDERNTTVMAHNYLNTTDVRGKKRKAVVDSVAATIILQDYLEFRRNRNERKGK